MESIAKYAAPASATPPPIPSHTAVRFMRFSGAGSSTGVAGCYSAAFGATVTVLIVASASPP